MKDFTNLIKHIRSLNYECLHINDRVYVIIEFVSAGSSNTDFHYIYGIDVTKFSHDAEISPTTTPLLNYIQERSNETKIQISSHYKWIHYLC